MKPFRYIPVLLLLALPAQAANLAFSNAINAEVGQAINVVWPSNTISLSQLQGLMGQNPGASQVNIQFPNNTSWGVTPSMVQGISSNYAQQGQSLGFGGHLPNLNFSALRDARFDPNMLTVPISNLGDSLQLSVDNGLRELRYQQMHLSDSLPDWLKDSILWVWNALVWCWNALLAGIGWARTQFNI